MATVTLGTAATSTLTALAFAKSAAAADVATIAQAIKNDQINGGPIYPDAFNLVGRVFIPNRGVLTLLPGDYVAVDPATGWPIVLSAAAAAGASYVHT